MLKNISELNESLYTGVYKITDYKCTIKVIVNKYGGSKMAE